MKDDFYKDMKHKRAQDEKSSKKSAGNKKSDEPKRENLSRSARHKSKEAGENKQPDKKPAGNKPQRENNFKDKLKGYFSAENAAKGKAFFAGQFSAYQHRIKNELKISKEKLGSIGAGSKAAGKNKSQSDGGKKRMLPWVLAVLVLIPITVLLAFLIFSNFWPSLNDEINVADDNTSEETADNGSAEGENESEEGFNEELEAQKAEHERRLAENRNEDLAARDLETNYSQEELQDLEEASLNAIRTKEDEPEAETETDSDSESEETPEDTETESAEEDTDTEAESDTETETPETENANASHVVTPEDNLYRIAIQYYGDGSAANVQRIMEANGVTPDNLTVGQELIIP